MAFEPLNNSTPIIKARHLKEGDSVCGYFVGTFVSEQYPENVAPRIKLAEPLKCLTSKGSGDEEQEIQVDAKEGDEVILASTGNIKYFISDENEKGLLYKFVYAGMKPITKGPAKGKTTHRFEILRDPENKIEVSDVAENTLGNTEDVPF